MGVNFPTAFWKNQQDNRVDEGAPPTITWDLNLYYGLGLEDDLSDVTSTRNFYFDDYIENGGTAFNPEYNSETLGTTTSSPAPYFGWYLQGGNVGGVEYFNTVHRSNPWITEEQGRKIDLLFEADVSTWEWLSEYLYVDPDRDIPELSIKKQSYNHFIQSGRAVGTFTLTSSSTLTIKCSGLGERHTTTTPLNSLDHWDQMQLYLNGAAICSGIAPSNSPLVSAAQSTPSFTEGSDLIPWDVDQCKFFNPAGTQSPNPNPSRQDLNTSLYDDLGNVANYSNDIAGGYALDNVVEQSTRRKYTTIGGQFSTTQSLSAGTHTITMFFNTNDGIYQSGAFYGATFSFS